MLRVWNAPVSRSTKDIDLLGQLFNTIENLIQVVRDACAVDVEPDGMVYHASTIEGKRIKEDTEYQGVRLKFSGTLGKAQSAMQIDVGFGDTVVPRAEEISYPTILDLPAPRLRGYPRETVIAEKFQTLVYLGTLNSRMKDFYDLWHLSRQFDFEGTILAEAIRSTFTNRNTAMERLPIALTSAFFLSLSAQTQWSAFVRKGRFTDVPGLDDIVGTIAEFVLPVAQACHDHEDFPFRWRAPGPWLP
jgi:hypothetical protein